MNDSRRDGGRSWEKVLEIFFSNERKSVAAVRLHGLVKPQRVNRPKQFRLVFFLPHIGLPRQRWKKVVMMPT
ncbi:MAG TPA: hypothetical protein VHI52_18250 [Verrucomicrobiae bacterium]|nr:hypothetical protein [Verrucomicrobiae bacterium]